MIDVVRLHHIVLVAREGSFGRAAQAANLSQPALTRSVQATERQFGIKIFDRSRTGVFLTRAGMEFLTLAEDFVRRADRLDTELRAVGSAGAGAVSFGVGPLAATLFVAEIAELIFEKDIRAVVRIDTDAALRRLLLDGEIAFYIGGSWRGASDFAHSSRLRMDDIGVAPYRLVVRKGHPLDGADTITPQQLSAYPVIGGSLVRRILDDQVLGSVGLRQPSLELDDYPLLIEAAVRSDAILVGSPLLVGSAWGRDLVPINIQLPEDRVNLRASVVTLEGRTLTPIARLIADRFASLLRRATGAVLETQKS